VKSGKTRVFSHDPFRQSALECGIRSFRWCQGKLMGDVRAENNFSSEHRGTGRALSSSRAAPVAASRRTGR
jgi:hypothetical protein